MVIADIEIPAVLGYDCMSKNHCSLDINNQTILINDQTVLCKLESQLPNHFRISIDKDITIHDLQEATDESILDQDVFVEQGDDHPPNISLFEDMLNRCQNQLTPDQYQTVPELMNVNKKVFSTSKYDIGLTNIVKHKIDTNNARPIKQAPRRLPMAQRKKESGRRDTENLRPQDYLSKKWVNMSTIKSSQQYVLPSCCHLEVLKMLHNDPVSEHMGITRTTARVRHRFYWVGYQNFINRYCEQCVDCQKHKGPSNNTRGAMKTYVVGETMDRVALDILGPLPQTYNRNKFLLVVTDYFT
ncbi:unnamed protein product [Mytilus edulis]|uniref:Integrase zinc-binding domain-containing protein n=1 Tax=Mytilus edulis TaxID=6550 RepID=A0A8S3RD41_MYTED|nr:unnamed protein product [Mytilus edulis]